MTLSPLKNVKDSIPAAFIAVFFAVGLIGHVVLLDRMKILTPFVLWFFGVYVFVRTASFPSSRRLILWTVLTYAVTFTLEAVGTATGQIFGPYTYGHVLGFMLWSVPVVIGFNWVLVVLGALRLVQRLPAWAAILLTGIMTTAFDWIMEPVAVTLGYWTWQWDGIPLQNYLAWFLISSAAAAVFRLLKIRFESRLIMYYIAIQALFFTGLRFLLRI